MCFSFVYVHVFEKCMFLHHVLRSLVCVFFFFFEIKGHMDSMCISIDDILHVPNPGYIHKCTHCSLKYLTYTYMYMYFITHNFPAPDSPRSRIMKYPILLKEVKKKVL